MLKAGSLTYAIFLAVVTAILCSMMILLAFMNRSFFVQMDVHEVVKDNAYSGVAMGLASQHRQDFEKWVDLYDEGGDSVYLKKRRWGVYDLISSRAVKQGEEYQKTTIAGYNSTITEKTALWLTDQNRPLQVTGNALIKGRCYLPKKGVDRAYVEGKSYKRDQLIYGGQQASNSNLLQVDDKLMDYWRNYLQHTYTSQDSVVNFEELGQKTEHSFQRKTLVAFSEALINLRGFSLSGNIIVISATEIIISPSARLKDVVLVAPEISVSKGTKFRGQLVASDSILLEADTRLKYPSSLLLVLKNKNSKPYCKMDDGSRLNGSLISYARRGERTNDLSVEMAHDAEINGLLYSQGNLELHGKVNGLVIGNQFLLATPSGIYENHLLDGRIDRSALPEEFASVSFDQVDNHAMIASWLSY